jgi:hypothetical protein
MLGPPPTGDAVTRTLPQVLVLLLALGLAACAGSDAPVVDGGGAALEASEVVDDVDASPTPEASPSVAPSPSPSPIASPSATASPTADGTPTTGGSPAAPTFDEVCAGRSDEAFIEVLTPQPGTVVTDPVTVEGCGNTFEATFVYEVTTPDGEELVADFGTMSCGNGCVGEFAVTVDVDAAGPVVLTVFETDAQDGSRQHVVEVPITIE